MKDLFCGRCKEEQNALRDTGLCIPCEDDITHEKEAPVPDGIIDVYLDDVRITPDGWVRTWTDKQTRDLLRQGMVRKLSLDHDLGACDKCLNGRNVEQWLEENGYNSTPHCEHFGTGYTLLCWMEENDIWPAEKPTVHSANPVGRKRMQAVIDRKYHAYR